MTNNNWLIPSPLKKTQKGSEYLMHLKYKIEKEKALMLDKHRKKEANLCSTEIRFIKK